MISWTARLLERYFDLRYERGVRILSRIVVALAAMMFVIMATIIVAFESIFPEQGSVATLQVGDTAPEDIFAPETISYVSTVLTEQSQQAARDSVRPIYDPPDPNIARQRTQLARQILDFIDNVRRDPYATNDQRVNDLNQIRELRLEPAVINRILEMDNDTWNDVDEQIGTVLERVMRGEIRETDLSTIQAQLPTQVAVRFEEVDRAVIVSIVEDLIRPNTSENVSATEAARQTAIESTQEVRRGFKSGQLVVASGSQIAPEDYEALQHLNLLRQADERWQEVGRGLLASIVVMVIVGLYILRFWPALIYTQPRFLTLLAAIFLIVLAGARLGLGGQIYIYPTAALALLYVTIIGPEIAIIGVLGLASLVGLMANNSLEIAVLVGAGGIIGSLTLKRPERLNNFFFAGLMVALVNTAIAAIFNLATPTATNTGELALLVIYSLLNGILTAAAAIAGMYIVTLIFNLPTALKLVELSQPNQPLLQRLLREAPGTYQHSLQVANLAEQAANAIGANAELTHVAALYHDIGKVLNPAFFTENQHDIGNPHNILNDPYRSADIIISHVTQGDEMARQNRLPNRMRDFIREHHGTTQVYVFYRQAVILANDDESAVDISDFTYPGPKPQSRETGILMLADGCEALVRSREPKSRKEIEDIVHEVADDRRKSGQLDESGLTLNDLKAIQAIFIDMLQAVFHPRINYSEAIARVRKAPEGTTPAVEIERPAEIAVTSTEESHHTDVSATKTGTVTSSNRVQTLELTAVGPDDDGDAPLTEVPRLRRTSTREVNTSPENGTTKSDEFPDKEPTKDESGE